MRQLPKNIFINEYDWGLGGAYFMDFAAAKEAAVKRTSDTEDTHIKTHIYQLAQS